MLAFDGNLVVIQHFHHAVGRARLESRLAYNQRAKIRMMETVDIFFRGDRFDNGLVVDMLGHRQLHEYAVYRGVVVERADLRQQFRLRCGGGQGVQLGMHAHGRAGLHFVAHINMGRRIVAHNDHRKTGRHAATFQRVDFRFKTCADAVRKFVTVDYCCGHFVGMWIKTEREVYSKALLGTFKVKLPERQWQRHSPTVPRHETIAMRFLAMLVLGTV